jgi:hypothetical protein
MRAKLCRPENRNMKLSTMQDIAGCRAVLDSVEDVRRLANEYGKTRRDYIARPKPDGYRSIHIVEHQHGCQVEIQIRSAYQHVWAAAVETIDLLRGERLKVGSGHEDWKKFFRLAASALALHEHCPPVPDTPSDWRELASELKKASDKVHALQLLKGIHLVPWTLKSAYTQKSGAAYLIVLDMRNENHLQTSVRVYQARELENANQEYIELEKEFAGEGNEKRQALLLSVEQAEHIEPAYPAFFLQAHQFIWTLEEFTNEKNAGI